jgi:hypothetical protein
MQFGNMKGRNGNGTESKKEVKPYQKMGGTIYHERVLT